MGSFARRSHNSLPFYGRQIILKCFGGAPLNLNTYNKGFFEQPHTKLEEAGPWRANQFFYIVVAEVAAVPKSPSSFLDEIEMLLPVSDEERHQGKTDHFNLTSQYQMQFFIKEKKRRCPICACRRTFKEI
ncbi:unnamed protein product [Protopolystoma xenopodis]|uniref:Uncharacterized protein n=1 Tax=Protopolystoma xenopodis TaxID=117903 RepID=A0A448WYC8_9PLAT|nr:unnamed protein product [Protopolystoma xenopodis]